MDERILATFQHWNVTGDGSISRVELRQMFAALAPGAADAHVDRLFDAMDTNRNGKIEYEEWAEFLCRDTTEELLRNAGLRLEDVLNVVPESGLDTEETKMLHSLLDTARDHGNDKQSWQSIVGMLRHAPRLVNAKPSKRRYALIHHAVWYNNLHAVKALVHFFQANLYVRTLDGYTCFDLAQRLRSGEESAAHEANEYDRLVEYIKVLASHSGSLYVLTRRIDPILSKHAGNIRVWLWEKGNGLDAGWEPFSAREQEAIETQRKLGEGKVTLTLGGRQYELLLEKLLQRRVDDPRRLRNLIHIEVLWQWNSSDVAGEFAWVPYAPSTQWRLEEAFQKRRARAAILVDGKEYEVDTVGLRQYVPGVSAYNYRLVRRLGVPLSHEAASGVVCDGVAVNLTALPDHWPFEGAADSGDVRICALTPGHPIVSEIQEMMSCTIATGHTKNYGLVPGPDAKVPTGFVVEKVEVVHSPNLWARYLCHRADIQPFAEEVASHPGSSWLRRTPPSIPRIPKPNPAWGLDERLNEQYFWHGTGKTALETIIRPGKTSLGASADELFSETVSEGMVGRFSAGTAMFGSGLYLADLSSKANLYVPCPLCNKGSYYRERCDCSAADVAAGPAYRMLLCRAVLGRIYVELNHDAARYADRSQNPARRLGVDSVMGESSVHPKATHNLRFREYVVYDDRAVYPEFIVHYRRR